MTAEPDRVAVTSAGDADSLWDDWEAPLLVPQVPKLHLEGFDGPLDALLDLAERERIDLARLSITDLEEQFVAAMLRYEREVPVERRADWLVLASRLLVLRSRLLCTADPAVAVAAAEEAAREVQRLRDRQFVRAAASWLDGRPQLGRDVFARPARERSPRVASYMALMEACLALLEREEGADGTFSRREEMYRPAVPQLFRVGAAMARLRAGLGAEPAPLRVFLPGIAGDLPGEDLMARSAVASTLVAALELSRSNEAVLSGSELFEEVQIALLKVE